MIEPVKQGDWNTGEMKIDIRAEKAKAKQQAGRTAMIKYLRSLDGLAATSAEISEAISCSKDLPMNVARKNPRTFRFYIKSYRSNTEKSNGTHKYVIALNPDLAR